MSSEPLTASSLEKIPLSYATCSLGSPIASKPASLQDKLSAIANAGFQAIELSMPDLLSFAGSQQQKDVKPDDYDALCEAAKEVKSICDQKGLKILVLQPFSNFEGWPNDTPARVKDWNERVEAWDRAGGWMRIMEACGCDMLQVGSTDTPLTKLQPGEDEFKPSENLKKRIVEDLRRLAALLATRNCKIAYENWCWSSHAPTWKDVWSIVKAVDRPNVGLCLDTFQTAGSEWADPTTSSGLIESVPKEELEKKFAASLDELKSTVPPEKIFFFQISDAYKPQPAPLSAEVKDGTAPRGRWSHSYRPLPFDGGYLPVVDVVKAVLGTGFRGWFSYEVFDAGPDEKKDNIDIAEQAKKAKDKHADLMVACVENQPFVKLT